jgi:hypothetical protein
MAGVMLLSVGACDLGDRLATKFTASLSGTNETPPVTTNATGTATFESVGTSIRWVINVAHLSGPATAAHIYVVTTGTSGIVAMHLCGTTGIPACASDTAAATLQGSSSIVDIVNGNSLDGLLTAMRENAAYVNVHTAANPGGEIRGAILPAP